MILGDIRRNQLRQRPIQFAFVRPRLRSQLRRRRLRFFRIERPVNGERDRRKIQRPLPHRHIRACPGQFRGTGIRGPHRVIPWRNPPRKPVKPQQKRIPFFRANPLPVSRHQSPLRPRPPRICHGGNVRFGRGGMLAAGFNGFLHRQDLNHLARGIPDFPRPARRIIGAEFQRLIIRMPYLKIDHQPTMRRHDQRTQQRPPHAVRSIRPIPPGPVRLCRNQSDPSRRRRLNRPKNAALNPPRVPEFPCRSNELRLRGRQGAACCPSAAARRARMRASKSSAAPGGSCAAGG